VQQNDSEGMRVFAILDGGVRLLYTFYPCITQSLCKHEAGCE
jgi:hypothetical protein